MVFVMCTRTKMRISPFNRWRSRRTPQRLCCSFLRSLAPIWVRWGYYTTLGWCLWVGITWTSIAEHQHQITLAASGWRGFRHTSYSTPLEALGGLLGSIGRKEVKLFGDWSDGVVESIALLASSKPCCKTENSQTQSGDASVSNKVCLVQENWFWAE